MQRFKTSIVVVAALVGVLGGCSRTRSSGSQGGQATGPVLVVRTMPGFPHAPNLSPAQRHPARPGKPVVVFGNASGITSGQATYQWSFTHSPNVTVVDDGDLTGAVGTPSYIYEEVEFQLSPASKFEVVRATLTVEDAATSASQYVEIQVIDPLDPGNSTPLQQQQVDVNIAIQNGLRWLYRAQQPQGYWQSYSGASRVGETAFVLWAFQNQGHLESNDTLTDIYADGIAKGLQWLLAQATLNGRRSAPLADIARGATAAGVSDLNANGDSVGFSGGWPGYEHPAAIAALVATNDPNKVVTVGQKSMTYKQIVEDAVDWIGGGQDANTDATWSSRGGWTYHPLYNARRSDMSINSWMYVAMEGAEAVFGVIVPDWIKQETEHALVGHQRNAVGPQSFGYTGISSSHSHATTGGGLSGLVLAESTRIVPPGAVIAAAGGALNSIALRRQAAIDWLADHWDEDGSNPGNRNNFYAMWTVARALRITAQATQPGQKILLNINGTLLDWETGELNGSGQIAAPGSAEEGYFTWLIRNQNLSAPLASNGGWSNNNYVGPVLATAFSVLILTPTVFVGNQAPNIAVVLNGQGQNCPVTISGSEGVDLSFDVVITDRDPADIVTVTVTGAPPGSTHTPQLPLTGSRAMNVKFRWTPPPAQTGTWNIIYSADDGSGNMTSCTVQLSVATCLLLGGSETGPIALPGATLAVIPELMFRVTTTQIPQITIPADPVLMGKDMFWQVFMHNPYIFPQQPTQVSPILQMTLGTGQVQKVGSGTIRFWAIGTPWLGAVITFGFDIQGG